MKMVLNKDGSQGKDLTSLGFADLCKHYLAVRAVVDIELGDREYDIVHDILIKPAEDAIVAADIKTAEDAMAALELMVNGHLAMGGTIADELITKLIGLLRFLQEWPSTEWPTEWPSTAR